MKKLSNISPFLLLLIPVFIMMLLTVTTGNTNTQDEEVALKAEAPVKNVVIKINNPFSR